MPAIRALLCSPQWRKVFVSHCECTVQGPYCDRAVTGPFPCTHQHRTTTNQGPDRDRSRTVSPDQHCAVTGPAPCCHWTMHGPCTDHAGTMLGPCCHRTKHAPNSDHTMTVHGLSPHSNRAGTGPCKDHARTVLGPCKDRAVTVLSPCCHRAITALSLNQVKPCFYRKLYAITW